MMFRTKLCNKSTIVGKISTKIRGERLRLEALNPIKALEFKFPMATFKVIIQGLFVMEGETLSVFIYFGQADPNRTRYFLPNQLSP